LRGHLAVSDSDYQQQSHVSHGPEAGTVWVDQRVLSALNRQLGETLTVGAATLRIAKVLHYEPDKRGDFYSFSPRVMLHQADLAATKAIQPGSHAFYGQQWRGQATLIAAFKPTLKAQLNPSQRLLDLDQDRPELCNALQRVER
jgi:putative ABC transport system permease protein